MEEKKLKKEISLAGALSTVMGTVIGAGVFFKAAAVVEQTQSVKMTLLVWLLAGFLTICGGLTVSELATAIPETGGPVKYIEKTYGRLPAFLLGWAQTIIYFPANVAALSIIFATQLINLFQFPVGYLMPIAIMTALSVTAINLLGTKIAAGVQSLTLVVKLLPIAAIIIFGLFTTHNPEVSVLNVVTESSRTIPLVIAFSGALLATLFAYDGWMHIGNIAGELKSPSKDLPKAIIFGLSSVTVIYVLINYVFLKVLPLDQISGNLNASSEVAMQLFGNSGGKIVTIGILISVYGALNGYIMTGTRVPYTLALADELPFSKHLRKLSPKTSVPYMAAWLQFGIACIMMMLGNFDVLTNMLIFVLWLFSVLLFVGVLVLRKKQPDLPRPYRVPLYPIVPIIAIIGGAFILIMTIITSPVMSIIGIGITLLGVPIYWYKKMR